MRTKKMIWSTAIGLIAVILTGCLFIRPQMLALSIDLSAESVGGVKIGENISSSSFTGKYQQPLDKQDNTMYDYYEWEGGLATASINNGPDKGTIMRLIISGPDNPLTTAKGIHIGDSKEKVLSLYGKKYYKSGEQGADIVGYIDRKQNLTLEFWCVNSSGEVAMIRLDDAGVR
ncbi:MULTISPECIES: hypothetical protein [unclassified Paenibacillus]|uniref:hypothetical protein n=1 Tax=unclassified Paenibacillus TaxID=185978 RepID=UPI0024061EE9|nr:MULTISPECIES: hypothetical protein [unclassified Paenibacillus]MDF9839278.1 hypothetical protein [Paenibacillus sp. PastF-2]MDF9845859.1 hypothetical protein [Paenibacillus sp. PastM-2]MDF9852432.1 hypothetical protein [Paenibacillus sp. PastF-1]MDH6477838.1 hypothetical protein [Paenibacillus sp. PastH-2]MDH6505577.1 hypothetical protein [Paenibacillus sp. PastM-3]